MSLGMTQGSLLSAAVGGWTPASLPSLLAWYSADSLVYSDAGTTLATNTQTVQQWNDKSGNGYHLKQATGGNRPQYLSGGFNSKQTIQFTFATPTWMRTDSASVAFGTGANFSCFVVGQMLTGTGTNARLVAMAGPAVNDYDAGGIQALARNGATNDIYSYRGGNVGSQTISLATNYRLGMVYDGVNGTSYVNNASPTSTANTNAFSGGPGAITVGTSQYAGPTALAEAWDGPISEIVLTLSALSSTDRDNLDTYFQSHWGL